MSDTPFEPGEARPLIDETEVEKAVPSHGFLHDYVKFGYHTTDCHAIYHVGAGLAALTQAVHLDVALPADTTGKLRLTTYILLVGSSSESRKTAAISIARAVIANTDPAYLGEEPGSQEALVDQLVKQEQQLIVYGEFGSQLASMEHGYLTPVKTKLTQVYDCLPISRNTVAGKKAGKVSTCENPRLSLLAGCAPEYLERHTEEADWTGGFFNRFLVFNAEKRERNKSLLDVKPIGLEELTAHYRGLCSRQTGVISGPCLGVSAGAQLLFRAWEKEGRKIVEKASSVHRGAISRAGAHALKLSGLLAWDIGNARSGNSWQIGEEEMASAIAICTLHIRSVYELSKNLAPTKEMREKRQVLEVISYSPISIGDISKKCKISPIKKLRDILQTLRVEKRIELYTVGGEECFVRINENKSDDQTDSNN